MVRVGIEVDADINTGLIDNQSSTSLNRQPLVSGEDYYSDGDGTDLLLSRQQTNVRKGIRGNYPAEWYKTFVMAVYLLLSLFLTGIFEVVVHDLVPRKL